MLDDMRERVWVADPAWIFGGDGKLCRDMTRVRDQAGWGNRYCRAPAVAAFRRGQWRIQWWYYCEEHLHGRRIRNGVVQWHILKDGS